MRIVYKYQVDLLLTGQPQEVKMEKDAVLLPVAMQEGNKISFWAECPVPHGATTEVTRLFTVHATGQPYEIGLTRFGQSYVSLYAATAATQGSVWHLYELHPYPAKE